MVFPEMGQEIKKKKRKEKALGVGYLGQYRHLGQ